jgi:hypothetical protein
MRIKILAFGVACTLTAVVAAQDAPATRPAGPAQTSPAATQKAPKAVMMFEFRDAPVDSVLDALSENFGFVVIKTATIPGRITVINRGPDGKGLSADEAVEVTNSLLYPLGYGLLERPLDSDGKPVLRVATINELKKQAPVRP